MIPTEVARPTDGVDSSFEDRWARWSQRGAEQDRVWNRRAAITGAAGFVGLGIWLAITLSVA